MFLDAVTQAIAEAAQKAADSFREAVFGDVVKDENGYAVAGEDGKTTAAMLDSMSKGITV